MDDSYASRHFGSSDDGLRNDGPYLGTVCCVHCGQSSRVDTGQEHAHCVFCMSMSGMIIPMVATRSQYGVLLQRSEYPSLVPRTERLARLVHLHGASAHW